MAGVLRFLRVPGGDARKELKDLLAKYGRPPQPEYEVCFKLVKQLIAAGEEPESHLEEVREWKSFEGRHDLSYPVIITETDPFVVYTIICVEAEKQGEEEYENGAIHFGERRNRPDYVLYDEVWNETRKRLQQAGW